MTAKAIIVIPARLAATRLPAKSFLISSSLFAVALFLASPVEAMDAPEGDRSFSAVARAAAPAAAAPKTGEKRKAESPLQRNDQAQSSAEEMATDNPLGSSAPSSGNAESSNGGAISIPLFIRDIAQMTAVSSSLERAAPPSTTGQHAAAAAAAAAPEMVENDAKRRKMEASQQAESAQFTPEQQAIIKRWRGKQAAIERELQEPKYKSPDRGFLIVKKNALRQLLNWIECEFLKKVSPSNLSRFTYLLEGVDMEGAQVSFKGYLLYAQSQRWKDDKSVLFEQFLSDLPAGLVTTLDLSDSQLSKEHARIFGKVFSSRDDAPLSRLHHLRLDRNNFTYADIYHICGALRYDLHDSAPRDLHDSAPRRDGLIAVAQINCSNNPIGPGQLQRRLFYERPLGYLTAIDLSYTSRDGKPVQFDNLWFGVYGSIDYFMFHGNPCVPENLRAFFKKKTDVKNLFLDGRNLKDLRDILVNEMSEDVEVLVLDGAQEQECRTIGEDIMEVRGEYSHRCEEDGCEACTWIPPIVISNKVPPSHPVTGLPDLSALEIVFKGSYPLEAAASAQAQGGAAAAAAGAVSASAAAAYQPGRDTDSKEEMGQR
jgi:hypothetical protein